MRGKQALLCAFGLAASECANGKALCYRRTGEMLGGTYLVEASYDGGNGVDVYAEGTRPHLVCSAMGKTTNGLLAAADAAIAQGPTFAVKDAIGPIRELHAETAATLELEDSEPYAEVVALLDELERTLEGVAMLGELSVRIKDRVVSYAAPPLGLGRRRGKTSEGAR